MKSRMKSLLFCMLVIASGIWSYVYFNQSEQDGDLLLSNIDALAYPEYNHDIFCFGSGSIDCPISHTKVDEVYEEY